MSADVVALKGDVTQKEAKEQGIGYAMVYTADLGNGRQISIQTNLPTNAQGTDFDEVLDTLGIATLRQSKIADIPALEVAIVRDHARVKEIEALLGELRGKEKLAGNERSVVLNHLRDIARIKEEIVFKERTLEQHKALLMPPK